MTRSPNHGEVYTEVRLEVPTALFEIVGDYVAANISSGLVFEGEEDASSIRIKFYVRSHDVRSAQAKLSSFLKSLLPSASEPVPALTCRPVCDLEWERQYRDSVRPVLIDDDIVVRPPWEEAPAGRTYDIVLEPKTAFGTGRHETTRCCMQMIRHHFKPRGRFLDLGCGSGILSILASKLDARYIKAVDNDTCAVENCRENFELNMVPGPYDIVHGSVEVCARDEPYDCVCANLTMTTIRAMLAELAGLVASPGVLILSGLLLENEAEISAAVERLGLKSGRSLQDNEWLTLEAVRR